MSRNSFARTDASYRPPAPDGRLFMVAQLIYPGEIIADIGTDHAYLPCFLINNGIVERAVAADVADGPLRNAEKTVRRYGLSQQIVCRKSDGLQSISPSECTTVVFSGMGGTLICELLAGVDWLRTKRLVFQPMSHAEDVRAYLCANGFVITEEAAAIADGKPYIAFSAVYAGANPHFGDRFYYWFGSYCEKDDAGARGYINKQKKRLSDRLAGLRRAGQYGEEAAQIQEMLDDNRIKGL